MLFSLCRQRSGIMISRHFSWLSIMRQNLGLHYWNDWTIPLMLVSQLHVYRAEMDTMLPVRNRGITWHHLNPTTPRTAHVVLLKVAGTTEVDYAYCFKSDKLPTEGYFFIQTLYRAGWPSKHYRELFPKDVILLQLTLKILKLSWWKGEYLFQPQRKFWSIPWTTCSFFAMVY